MKVKNEEYYRKSAAKCWVIAGIFFAITIVLKTLVLVLTILGY